MKPIKISFFLKKSVKSDQKPIILKGNFGFKRYDPLKQKDKYESLVYYTGYSSSIDDWNTGESLPFDAKTVVKLEELSKKVEIIYKSLQSDGIEITPELLKTKLDSHKTKNRNTVKKRNSSVRITEFIEEYIETDKNLSEGRIKHYKKLRGKLGEYEELKGFNLTTDKLNEEIYKGFLDFWKPSLTKANSVWSIHKDFKSTLNKIRKKFKIEFYNPIDLDNNSKPKQAEAPRVFLTLAEAELILKYNPSNEKLRNVQFILATLIYTGCRFSDVYKILPEKSYDKKGIQFNYAHYITQKKPQTEVIAPILKPLQKFYDENDGQPPRKISSVKFNLYVKELICEMRDDPDVEFDKEFKLSYTDKNNKKKFETVLLSEKISSHIGRISFITGLIHLVPVTILAKITAHQINDSSVIFSYNKMGLLDNAVLFVEELNRIQDNGRLEVELV